MSDDLIKRLQYLGRVAKDYDQEHMTSSDYEMIPAVTKQAADRIKKLERENAEIDQPFFNLYAEAFTKIKAVVDGKSEKSIKAIVYELLDAFSAMGVKE